MDSPGLNVISAEIIINLTLSPGCLVQAECPGGGSARCPGVTSSISVCIFLCARPGLYLHIESKAGYNYSVSSYSNTQLRARLVLVIKLHLLPPYTRLYQLNSKCRVFKVGQNLCKSSPTDTEALGPPLYFTFISC